MSNYTVCSDPSHDRYDQRKTDCTECQAEINAGLGANAVKGNPRVTPEPKTYPGRRRRFQKDDHVRVIFADGLATLDGTPLLNSTGMVARDESQYVEVINDYDGSATPFEWKHLELITPAIQGTERPPRKFENLAAAVHAGTECQECVKLRAHLERILAAIAGIE